MQKISQSETRASYIQCGRDSDTRSSILLNLNFNFNYDFNLSLKLSKLQSYKVIKYNFIITYEKINYICQHKIII